MNDQKILLLARGLSELFPSDSPDGPCACMSNCEQLGCGMNWEMLLRNPKRLKRLLRIGLAVAIEEERLDG